MRMKHELMSEGFLKGHFECPLSPKIRVFFGIQNSSN
jgi:hypothetical protein